MTATLQQALPFQTIKNKTFATLYKLGQRAVDLHEIWAGREPWRNELTSLLMAKARKANRYRVKDLSGLLDLPIEIIYQIFCYLHPLDLYNISRSTNVFRTMLSPSEMYWLWNTVFASHKGMPVPPSEGLSHLPWSNLLFGRLECNKCHRQRATPEWLTRQRLCMLCTRKKDAEIMKYGVMGPMTRSDWNYNLDQHTSFVTILRISIEHPDRGTLDDLEPIQLPLTVHLRPSSRYPWRNETLVFSRIQELHAFFGAVVRYMDPSCIRALSEMPVVFRQLLALLKSHMMCTTWFESLKELKKDENAGLRAELTRWIHKRLYPKIYDSYEWARLLNSIEGLNGFFRKMNVDPRHPIRSFRKRWQPNRLSVMTLLDTFARCRLDAEEQFHLIKRQRKMAAFHETLYDNLVGEHFGPRLPLADPDEFIPSATELLLYKPFNDMLVATQPDFPEPDDDAVNHFINAYESFFPKWPLDRISCLKELYPILKVPRFVEEYPNMLAVSASLVFYCVGCHYEDFSIMKNRVVASRLRRRRSIGWDKAVEHIEDGCSLIRWPHPLQIHEQASLASFSAMRLYHENPERISHEDMLEVQEQRKDIRLACMRCPDIIRSGMAMEWEDCVDHILLFQDDPAHRSPSWERVKPSVAKSDDIVKVFCMNTPRYVMRD